MVLVDLAMLSRVSRDVVGPFAFTWSICSSKRRQNPQTPRGFPGGLGNRNR